MAEHIFLIDVGNALDLEHYDIYFYERLSKGEISLFRTPIIDKDFMESIPRNVNKVLSRAPFEIDNYKIVFCFARRYPDNMSGYLCDLYLKNWISSCFQELREKTELIVIDMYNGDVSRENEETTRYTDLNNELIRKGYIPPENEKQARQLGFFPCESDLVHPTTEGDVPEYAKLSSIFSIIEKARESEDVKARYIQEFSTIDNRISQIKMMRIELSRTPEKTAMERLRLCRFILRNEEEVKEGPLEKQYQSYQDEVFDEDSQGKQLKRYYEGIQSLRDSLPENENESQKKGISYERKNLLLDIEKSKEIGGDADLKELMKRLFDITDKLNWEEEYFAIVHELESYEDSLEEYGKQLSRDFHTMETVRDDIEEETIEDAINNNHEELQEATKEFYEVRARDGDPFSTILDITNQFQRIHLSLKQIIERKRNGTWRRFLPIWVAAVLMALVPYLISQTYIFSGVIKGSMIPIICALVFVLSFLISKYVVQVVIYIQLRFQMNRLKRKLKKYLDGLGKRQKQYHATINAMIGIFNAKSKMVAIDEEMSRRDDDYRRLLYHKRKADEMINKLNYFSPLLKNVVLQGESANKDVEISKSVEDNPIYWI